MQEDMVKKLVQIKTLLMGAMFILVMAEFCFLLYLVFDFMWAAIGAVIVLLIRIGFYLFQDNNGWQQKLLLALAVIGVLGPIFYYIYKVIFVDSSSFWLMLFLTVSFLLPVAIMYYIDRTLTKLISTPAPNSD